MNVLNNGPTGDALCHVEHVEHGSENWRPSRKNHAMDLKLLFADDLEKDWSIKYDDIIYLSHSKADKYTRVSVSVVRIHIPQPLKHGYPNRTVQCIISEKYRPEGPKST